MIVLRKHHPICGFQQKLTDDGKDAFRKLKIDSLSRFFASRWTPRNQSLCLDVKGLHVAAVHVASLLGCEDTGVLDEEMMGCWSGGFNNFQRFLFYFCPHFQLKYPPPILFYFKYPPPIVDGRNPAPVDMVNIPLFSGFYTSQVVQDFFHQQY